MKKTLFERIFKFGGSLNKTENLVIGFIGAIILLFIWYSVTASGKISGRILPNPVDVWHAFPSLYNDYNLMHNIWYTVSLNLTGYIIALGVAIPLGFIIGIFPITDALFKKYFEALRYTPLPTVSGIFIAIFGLGFGMKSKFLAFGIFIFMLPSILQKITDLQNPTNEKDYTYIESAKTLGLSNWQMFRYVYWPYVIDKIYQDIRSLVAISYTYVVISECFNKEGGIGAAISTFTRQSRTAEVYALLFVIILIGILQDKIFRVMDPILFPYHKKQK